ncbi:hypothetical protein K1719_000490 [Acacia pycnantha]|nr:hypothetical protein K1719_000490 [Acacia pycnantha]
MATALTLFGTVFNTSFLQQQPLAMSLQAFPQVNQALFGMKETSRITATATYKVKLINPSLIPTTLPSTLTAVPAGKSKSSLFCPTPSSLPSSEPSSPTSFSVGPVPYCPSGDLHLLLHRQVDQVFSPSVIRFYLAEI